jgi:hypothetical protein
VAGTELHYDEGARTVVFATRAYGSARRMYELLPAVHQRLDAPPNLRHIAAARPALAEALAGLPEPLRERGALERFLHVIGAPFDLMRGFAEGLPQLHDSAEVRPEFASSLARFAGWELDRTLPLYQQRNEIRFAPHVYRRVGSVPSLRSMVTRYSGWKARVSESAERLTRANEPAQLNIFAAAEEDGTWAGVDDAGRALGFSTADNDAHGADGPPRQAAELTTPQAGPYALRPGMRLTVTVDERLPVVIRVQSGDFANMATAAAAEVAAVLRRELPEVATSLAAGAITMRSLRLGADSRVRVELEEASLVTLEGAPAGRPAAARDELDRLRLVYEAADPLAPWRGRRAAAELGGSGVANEPPRRAPAGGGAAAVEADATLAQRRVGRIRMKTHRSGDWGDSVLVPGRRPAPQRDPALCTLGDGRLLAAWIEERDVGPVVYWSTGTTSAPAPAALAGRRAAPFTLRPAEQIVLRGNWHRAEAFELTPAEAAAGTATAVATAMNARLRNVRATALSDATLLLETRASGGDERLEVDLDASPLAAALGFEAANCSASGDWGDDVAWSEPRPLVKMAALPADLYLVADPGGAGALLFFAAHRNSAWAVYSRAFDGTGWDSSSTQHAAPDGGAREPCAAWDDSGRLWLAWAQGAPMSFDWALCRKSVQPAGAAAALTAPTAGAADREPGIVALPDGTLRVYFSSDRAGGRDRWSVDLDPGGPSAPPVRLTGGPQAERAPVPILVGPPKDERVWLLHRSDRSVSLAHAGIHDLVAPDTRVTGPEAGPAVRPLGPRRSVRLEDAGTRRSFAGTLTAVPGDARRQALIGRFDDPGSYTPEGSGRQLGPRDLYTRGTVVLYLNRLVAESPLTQQRIERLQAVLARFLPVNVRVVVRLAPPADEDDFYDAGHDITDAYADRFPFVDTYAPGLAEERVAVALPDWALLRAARPASPPEVHRSADPTRPDGARERTFQNDLDPDGGWSNSDP